MRSFYFLSLIVLVFAVYNLQAAKPRLKAQSVYARYTTHKLPSLQLTDSSTYTYSGNRGGDPEGTLWCDSMESLRFEDGVILSGDAMRLNYVRDTVLSSTTSYQLENSKWTPTERTWAVFDSNYTTIIYYIDEWSGIDFVPSERWMTKNGYRTDTTQREQAGQNNTWLPLQRTITDFDSLHRRLLLRYETFNGTGWTEEKRSAYQYAPNGSVFSSGYDNTTNLTAFREFADSSTGNITRVEESMQNGSPVYDSTCTVYNTMRDSMCVHQYRGSSAALNTLFFTRATTFDAHKQFISMYDYKITDDGMVIPSTLYTCEYIDVNKRAHTFQYDWSNNHYRLRSHTTYTYTQQEQHLVIEEYRVDTLGGKDILREWSFVHRNEYGQLQEVSVSYGKPDSLQEQVHYYYYYEDVPTSVAEETSALSTAVKGISLYPNPASLLLNIRSEPDMILFSAEVFTQEGRQTYCPVAQESGVLRVNTSLLIPGTYVLQLKTSAGAKTLFFVKD